MESWSLYEIEFRHGPTVNVVSVAIASAMVDACEIASADDPDDGPLSRHWGLEEIQKVTERARPVYVSPHVMAIERRESDGSVDIRGQADRGDRSGAQG